MIPPTSSMNINVYMHRIATLRASLSTPGAIVKWSASAATSEPIAVAPPNRSACGKMRAEPAARPRGSTTGRTNQSAAHTHRLIDSANTSDPT